jgi:AcrR family transcriptional regulator
MSSRITRQQSQAQTRRRLIDAAKSAFREHGFHRASADALAAGAGFTRGALYANFDGKEGLFLAVLDEEIEARREAFLPTEDVRGAASVYRALLDGDRGWTLALLEFTTHAARQPELAEQLRLRNRALRAIIVGLLRDVRPDISPQSAEVGAKLVMAVNTGVALERALDSEAAGEAELARAYLAAASEETR